MYYLWFLYFTSIHRNSGPLMWSCKVADMVADLEVYMVIDMEVDKVGDMVICVGHTA